VAVSNNLPFQSFEENPKNWIYNRTIQNIPNTKDNRFPNGVFKSSVDEVRQRRPIRKITKAIKKVCTYINCRLAILNELNSCFHLKYFGTSK
jgi:hypothetical protein